MKAEDKIRFDNKGFDRGGWAQLWDRLPERARRAALRFVLHELHVIESGGTFEFTVSHETALKREEAGEQTYETDQPGDLITFKGHFRIGYR